jgi:tryptophan-rich hypothetical protein
MKIQLNKISPKALFNSKWTKVNVVNKEKHFVIIDVKFNEDQEVVDCVIEAVMTKNAYLINWRHLKNKDVWLIGWK